MKGFTLVEVMISVAILGIGLSIVANSYLVCLRGINASQNNIQAQLLAKAKLDELEALSITRNGLTSFSEQNVMRSSGRDYNYNLKITEIASPEYIAKHFLQACLSYSWQEQNASKSVAFSTYFPKHEEEKPKSI